MELKKVIHTDPRVVKLTGGGNITFRSADEKRFVGGKWESSPRDKINITGLKSAIEMSWTPPRKADDATLDSIYVSVSKWLGEISRSDAIERTTMEVLIDPSITLILDHTDTEHLNVGVRFECMAGNKEVKIDFGNPTAEVVSGFFERLIVGMKKLAR
jgi:hypothetical protein